MPAPCFVCLGEDVVTVSTGCGCSSSQICRPCAEWFTVEQTYERIDHALYHDERDPEVVSYSSVNPLWAVGRCTVCKQPFTGAFKTYLQQETLKLLFQSDKFPNGREYVYPGYVLMLLLETHKADFLQSLSLVKRTESVEAAFDALFKTSVRKLKDQLLVDVMSTNMAEMVIKVCTMEKAWLIRKMDDDAIMSTLPKDILKEIMLALRLRYFVARDLIKVAGSGMTAIRASMRHVIFAVEYQLAYQLWKPTEATEKESIIILTDALQIMLSFPYQDGSPEDQESIMRRIRTHAVQLGVFLDAEARYTDLQTILERVILWAHSHGLSSNRNVWPLVKGYCHLMTVRLRDQKAAIAFFRSNSMPVPPMPPAPSRRRSNRLAALGI